MRSVRRVSRARRPLVALVALIVALAVGYGVRAASSDDPGPRASASSLGTSTAPSASATNGAGTVDLSSLPPQAAQTLQLIRAGGPFPYPTHDGSIFRNDEHLLPSEPTGYYREYTVPTPGSDDRGARRLIVARDGAVYYTGDHYDSFRRVLTDR